MTQASLEKPGTVLRLLYGVLLSALGTVITFAALVSIGPDRLANFMPTLGVLYGAGLAIVGHLLYKFYDLARSPNLISKEVRAIEPALKKRARSLWIVIGVMLGALLIALVTPLSAELPSRWAAIWIFCACGSFFLAVYVATFVPFCFMELWRLEYQASERMKAKLERDAYVKNMRDVAKLGFPSDDNLDGSKRVVHGN